MGDDRTILERGLAEHPGGRRLTNHFGVRKELTDVLRAVYPKCRFRAVLVENTAFSVHHEVQSIRGKRDRFCHPSVYVSKVSHSDVVLHGKAMFRGAGGKTHKTHSHHEQETPDVRDLSGMHGVPSTES